MPPKVIFANRYFYPDVSATSQMLTDLALQLARARIEVHVVCSRQLYEDSRARLASHEVIDGVHVHRVWTARFGRGGLLGRAVDYLSFYLTAGVKLFRLLRPRDVLVTKTDPPLFSVVGALVAGARSAILVNWFQDVFPEVAVRLYAGSILNGLSLPLQLVRDASAKSARFNVVLGRRMLEYLVSRGIPPGRVRIIENWADGSAVQPKPSSASELRRRLGLQDRFVVCYSGNLGRAHEFDTMLTAAEQLRADAVFQFLVIGGGAKLSALRAQVAERGLSSFLFLPYQPRETLCDSLAAADVHLVCLLPQLEGLIVPSKIYGVLAAGRPAVYIGDPAGEIARLLAEGGCGITVPCGDGATLARELRALREDGAQMRVMGSRAREIFDRRCTLESAREKWIEMLGECGLSACQRNHIELRPETTASPSTH